MFVRLGKIFTVFALIASIGAHWPALQLVAWATMLGNNLCTQSVTEAVAHTFDGRHPCCLCKAIVAAKKSEKKNVLAQELTRLEFPPVSERIALIAPSQFELFRTADTFARFLVQKPPTPPPRGFFV